ncbi:MAG TPA: hypothetical protein VN842_03465 [Thermoplasmata archaeon]|nr:hypothetical protein [Thermoplasmata archaeon]
MVLFQSGETPIRSGAAVVLTQAGPRPGTLTLTNVAIVFETTGAPPPPGEGWGSPGGAGANEYRIGLWRVRQALGVKGPNGPVLQVNLLARVLSFQVDDIPGWAAVLTEARAHAPPPPADVQARRAMKKGGPAPPTRCAFCSQLSPAGSTKCASCGAPF